MDKQAQKELVTIVICVRQSLPTFPCEPWLVIFPFPLFDSLKPARPQAIRDLYQEA